MFVTILRYRVRQGMEEALREHNDEWKRSVRPDANGFINVNVYQSVKDPREWTNIAVFVDREAELENANTTTQRLWYQHMLELIEQKPAIWQGEMIQEG